MQQVLEEVFVLKARLKFTKYGAVKFIGHLDLMRFFQKAFRRAGIDVAYSQGYSPHQITSFAAPLGVGLTSGAEYMDMELNSSITKEEFLEMLNPALVDGIEAVGFSMLADDSIKSMTAVAAADYMVSLKDGYEAIENFSEQFMKFISKPNIKILKKTKKGEKELDIKPFIYEASLTKEEFNKHCMYELNVDQADSYDNDNVVFLRLCSGSVDNLKPELVMEAFCQYMKLEYNPFAYQVHRMEVYANDVIKQEKEAGKRNLVPLSHYQLL